MNRNFIGLLLVVAWIGTSPASAADDSAALIARGEYLARVMDCGGCHMPRGADGAPIPAAGLSGGTVGFEIPGLGIFWPSNLTPDETGLGGWSQDQVVTALRTGQRPDGRILAPAMPWQSFSGLTDEDASALAAYLLSLAPVPNPVPSPAPAGGDAPAPFYRVVLPKT